MVRNVLTRDDNSGRPGGLACKKKKKNDTDWDVESTDPYRRATRAG